MEWLYGLLIGSSFAALLMHLAHRGHKAEIREKPDAADGVLRVSAIPDFTFPTHVNTRDAVDRLDNTPPDCSCGWQGDQLMCEEEPRVWYRTLTDPECPVHTEPDEPIGDHKDWTHRTDL